MNRALNIKNWNKGGNSYILKGNPKNKWVGFQKAVIDELIEKFKDKFNLVIWTDKEIENDYYCIPFKAVKHLFTEERKTTGKYSNRWTAIIKGERFLMHSNQNYSIDISVYYALELTPKPIVELEEDYYIENAKAEINVRYGQSKFRKKVLNNFGNRCAVTGIQEKNLLRASHIIPWAHKKKFRGDFTNGISLYVEIDVLFDAGYISISDDLRIIISPLIPKFSLELKKKLERLDGMEIRKPKHELKKEYLKYHREKILKK